MSDQELEVDYAAEMGEEVDSPMPNYNAVSEDPAMDVDSYGQALNTMHDDDFSYSGQGDDILDYTGPPAYAIGRKQQVEMIHLRRYLDQLDERVQQKDYAVQKTREQLKKCRGRIQHLEQERDSVFAKIQASDSEGNTSAVYRLRAQHERICKEMENEEGLETKIKSQLEQSEYELATAQVEHGKHLLMEAELQQDEVMLERQRSEMADFRRAKEEHYAYQAQKRKRARDREQLAAEMELERKQRQALNEAKRSKERASKYLKQTVTRLRQREQEEEQRQKEHMEQRMTTMLALKKDITQNRENLRAIQARDRTLAKRKDEQEEAERVSIGEAGGNPEEEMIKKKKMEEFEKQKQQFESKQREKQIDIVSKILTEEERMKKRKQQQPQLWDDPKRDKAKVVRPHRRRKLKIFAEKEDNGSGQQDIDFKKQWEQYNDASSEDDDDITPYASFSRDDVAMSDSDEEKAETLAKPEFEGLWDQHKPYKVPKDVDSTLRLPGATKMDQEIMKKVLDKHREGIVVKQLAGGKEFKGVAFYSKPGVIHFKDFDVGKTYKKKVILTNVSYSVNYCKLIGITEHLKDFIDLHFDPPGQMSAGLTCELLVTFKPMINEDLEGEVSFLAQTGPFSIPLKCTTKKCDLAVDTNLVEFGTSVIGETLKRTFVLSNNGALATNFDYYKVTGLKPRTLTTAETSLGRLTTADTMHAVSPDSEEIAEAKAKESLDRLQGLKKDLQVIEEKKDEEKKEEGKSDEMQTDTEKPSDMEGLQGEGVGDLPLGEATGEQASGQSRDDADQTGDGQVGDSASSVGLPLSHIDEFGSLDGMKVGERVSGEIGPFSSVKLEILWQPTIPGQVDTEFVINFSDPLSESITIQAVATAIDVPVWVERNTVDLKICMFDRLYQDTIVVNNRATTALRLKFEVCKELRNHLELLPKTGYIQAQSQFSAQLKFLPRKGLSEEASKYFDPETGVLEAPMIIRVADQTRPVPFTVHAVVTNSDLEFDVTNIDFGCCTIYEAAKTTIKLTNRSILPQQFGFLGLHEYVDVQPNDGFGTLLPLETLELDIIFKPPKAKVYTFDLTCKSIINREFKISCKGVGVHPPLDLSHQVVHFKATTLNDVSTAAIHVVNSHTSTNEFTHPVPRIGRGEIAPVGPTSFEFVVPEGAPLTVSPSVGTVEPGKKCRIQVRFTPKLSDKAIRREAVKMVSRTLEARAQQEYQEAIAKQKESEEQAAKKRPPPKGKPSPKVKGKVESVSTVSIKGPTPIQPPGEDSIQPGSDEYSAAHGSLLRQFRGQFQTFVIPCYVASGKCRNPGELPYSIHNTLYLEVHCPAVKPQLVVISDHGRTTTDFGNVSIGQDVIKSITIQNISNEILDLTSSLLDTSGPFTMLNALRLLPPDATHTLLVSFTPHKGQVFQEVLEIKSPTSTLHVTLKGKGVSPMVTLSVREGLFDLGALLAGEYREEPFQIVNTSTLAVHFSIKLDSLSLLRHTKAQGIPAFIKRDTDHKSLVGTQNYNGQSVFDCVPPEGIIRAGESQEIMVTFAPDHESDHYSDGVRIELFGQEESHSFVLKGEAKPHIMYITGGEDLLPDIESLSVVPPEELDEDTKAPPIPVLVTLHSIATETEFKMASRDIYVGCVRTMAVSQKKNGEWSFDNLQPLAAKGFNIDPLKGMLEAGTKKPITITWEPLPGQDPNQPVEASILCTVRGDVTEQYRIMIRAFIISE